MIERVFEHVYRSYTNSRPFYIRELGKHRFWLSVEVPGMSFGEP